MAAVMPILMTPPPTPLYATWASSSPAPIAWSTPRQTPASNDQQQARDDFDALIRRLSGLDVQGADRNGIVDLGFGTAAVSLEPVALFLDQPAAPASSPPRDLPPAPRIGSEAGDAPFAMSPTLFAAPASTGLGISGLGF